MSEGIAVRERTAEDGWIEAAENLLAAMGATSQSIAVNLSEWGFDGIGGDACTCPVAKYLTQKLGCECSVGCNSAFVSTTGAEGVEVLLPHAAQWFITDYDAGQYNVLFAPGRLYR